MKKIRMLAATIAASVIATFGFCCCKSQKKEGRTCNKSTHELSEPSLTDAIKTDSDSIKVRRRRIHDDLITVKPLNGVQRPPREMVLPEKSIKSQKNEQIKK